MIRASVQRLEPYTPGEQPKIPNLIKLNTNENAYPPSPKVAEAIRSFDFAKLRLYPDPMCVRIREMIAAEHGCKIENVFVGNGSDEVLRLVTAAWVEDGGALGYFDPSYSLYPVLAAIRDVQGVAVPLPSAADFVDSIEKAALPVVPELFIIANPNAPTSTMFAPDLMRAFCAKYPGVVVVDEAYVAFAGQDCVNLALTMPNVVISRTVSKAWSLAGVRLGYLIGPADLIDAVYKIKDSYNVNYLTQEVVIAALSDPAWMLANRAKIIATRDRLASALKARGWYVADSATNFLWCSPPPPDTASSVVALLRSHGIIVRYFPGPVTGNHLRITIGTDEQTDTLLQVLKPGVPS